VCIHHWDIEPPGREDGKSTGVCRFCKEVREFYNSRERGDATIKEYYRRVRYNGDPGKRKDKETSDGTGKAD